MTTASVVGFEDGTAEVHPPHFRVTVEGQPGTLGILPADTDPGPVPEPEPTEKARRNRRLVVPLPEPEAARVRQVAALTGEALADLLARIGARPEFSAAVGNACLAALSDHNKRHLEALAALGLGGDGKG